jgi:DNA mismatch repair protein MutS
VVRDAVEEGPANRSYGLQVAKLAGVPAETIRQARAYLSRIDRFSAGSKHQTDLFAPAAAGASPAADPRAETVLERLASLDPDALSPRDAQAALYALKKLAEL